MTLKYADYLIPEHITPYQTIHEMLRDTCARHGVKAAFRMKTGAPGYRSVSYSEFWDMTECLARALLDLGLTSADRIAVQGENSPEWCAAWMAIMKTGAAIVPLDASLWFQDAKFIIEHSSVTAIALSRHSFERVWREHLAACPGIRHFIVFDEFRTDRIRIHRLDVLLERGRSSDTPLPQGFEPDDVIEILYTSGTTGNPKAVVLTHGNLASNVRGIHRLVYFDEKDNFLSVLPVHHVFEGTVGFLATLASGVTITFAESLKSTNLIANMREAGITVMLGVPLLFEKLYSGIIRAINKRPWHVRLMFHAMLALVRLVKAVTGLNIGRVVFRGLREKAGLGTIRLTVSGGGPLPYFVARGFIELGIRILQGYGLSETSPVLTCSTLAHDNIRAAGLPMPDTTIQISGPDQQGIGEIIVRGPGVMRGYYRNPEATAEVIRDGWFHTGDAGYIDKEGFIIITGRLKNVIVTHGGKNVYPEELEEKLTISPLIKECMVYGEAESSRIRGQKVMAIIVPDLETIREDWKGMPASRTHPEPTDEVIRAEIDRFIGHLNYHLPPYKRIVEWKVQDEELIKTSTRKVKRFLYKVAQDGKTRGAK